MSVGRIYVYSAPGYDTLWERTVGSTTTEGRGKFKVGHTTHKDVWVRIKQQTGTMHPTQEGIELHVDVEAVRHDGTDFKDHAVHAVLVQQGIRHDSEVFEATLDEINAAIASVKSGHAFDAERTTDFKPRPEQDDAVDQSVAYFTTHAHDSHPPRMLWNAKMRFGKTFTAYQLARSMGWRRILVLTYKPAVRNAWRDDLASHVDFAGWEFADRNHEVDPHTAAPLVRFTSFQDLLHKKNGRWVVKEHIEEIVAENWDCVVLDEFHFGSWQGAAHEVTTPAEEFSDAKAARAAEAAAEAVEEIEAETRAGDIRLYAAGDEEDSDIDVDLSIEDLKLSAGNFLYLSGTPFKALTEGEFNEDAIFNWTYPDEQREKRTWGSKPEQDGPNPYAELPQMQMFTYALPGMADEEELALDGSVNLSEFFKAGVTDGGQIRKAKARDNLGNYVFVNADKVNGFLDMLHGVFKEDDKKRMAFDSVVGAPFPYSDGRFAKAVEHTVWFMPDVASAFAMKNALTAHPRFKHFLVHVAAGNGAGMGATAKVPVDDMLDKARKQGKPTITLSVGKLMTGVTVPEWGAILMLRGLRSPESYFQAAFRVQSPWVIKDEQGNRTINKNVCLVFDFDPTRALSLVYEYGTKVAGGDKGKTPAGEVAELLEAMPVMAFDSGRMDPVDVNAVMDWGTAGIGAAMIARRWGSPRLIDLSEGVLEKLLANEDLLERLQQMEDFRNLREDAGKLLAKSKKVREGKKTAKEKGEPEDDETKAARKAKREQVQTLRKKLLKFLQAVPVFMYLTDHREEALVDVIRTLDPTLFERATGLTLKDFDALSEAGVFNAEVMDPAIWQFRLFEHASLDYLGLHEHEDEDRVGGWETVADRSELEPASE
jgi:hypothetical protein